MKLRWTALSAVALGVFSAVLYAGTSAAASYSQPQTRVVVIAGKFASSHAADYAAQLKGSVAPQRPISTPAHGS